MEQVGRRRVLRKRGLALRDMLRTCDYERQMIIHDIHDGLAQHLAMAIMQLQTYADDLKSHPQNAAKSFEAGMTMLRQGHAEARRLISGIRPAILDESGIVAAVAHLVYDPAFSDGPKMEFRSQVTDERLATVLENAVYRIVQEGLANVRKHSESLRARVSLVQQANCLRIRIRDWGVGFDPKKVPKHHFGLEGIRRRAYLLGGACVIRSKPGGGTVVIVDLPMDGPEMEVDGWRK